MGTLQEAIEAALPDLRDEALARMTSRATIRRLTGATTTVNGLEVPVWADVHTDLPCRVSGAHSGASSSRTLLLDNGELIVPVRTVSFPHDTTDLADGDLVDVTAGDTAGLVLRIVESDPQDQATARRVSAVGTTRPEEW